MRMHTDEPVAVQAAVRQAAAELGLTIEMLQTGSRSRRAGLELRASGSGRSGGQWGNNGLGPSATWDEWGALLAAAFAADEGLTIPRVYESAEHFQWATVGRFGGGMPRDAHKQHRWGMADIAAGGAYYVASCEGCTAGKRRMARGRNFGEING